MKKIILFLFLFSRFLLAEESSLLVDESTDLRQLFGDGKPLILKSYKASKDITISNIPQYAFKFKTQVEENRSNQLEVSISQKHFFTMEHNISKSVNWIMIKLDENLSSGNYIIEHSIFDFDKHSFLVHQHGEKFSLLGRKFFSFDYNKEKDSKIYFFKMSHYQADNILQASLYTPQTFSFWAQNYVTKLLISFFLLGLIFMTALYNGSLYLYNREKSFLYYMLMQLFMVAILVDQTDIIKIYMITHRDSFKIIGFTYFFLSLSTLLFVLYFTRSFLESQNHLPTHDKILYYISIAVIINMLFFFAPFIVLLGLYLPLFIYMLWVAWLRLKQGYKPALFFILGWFAILVGVFADYFNYVFVLDPMIVCSTIEALFLSVALSYRIKQMNQEKEEQKELLVHQSKLASMGEMLGNIAHQWRQPLSRLGYILMNIEAKDKEKHHEQKLEEASTQLEFMSQTIDDFRSFYEPNKKKELFSLEDETQKVIEFISFETIEIELKIVEDSSILNYKNEYKQVLLNLLTNAKDVLLERKIILPRIIIEVNATTISIYDNAGGISVENIEKIFEPYFTTKEKGMGIGLYMSKIIIERNMGGILKVENTLEGAVFKLLL